MRPGYATASPCWGFQFVPTCLAFQVISGPQTWVLIFIQQTLHWLSVFLTARSFLPSCFQFSLLTQSNSLVQDGLKFTLYLRLALNLWLPYCPSLLSFMTVGTCPPSEEGYFKNTFNVKPFSQYMYHACHAWESRPITQDKLVSSTRVKGRCYPDIAWGLGWSLYTGQNLRIWTCSSEFWGISLKNLKAVFYFVLPLLSEKQATNQKALLA